MKKTILNLRKQRLRRLAALAAFGLFAITAQAQVITWTSSNPAVATVDANGTVTPVSDGTVTITAAVTQNGKTVTSSKTVETVLDDCTACFIFQSSIDTQARTYCGVKLSNGQCWMDRNIGASRVATGYNDTSAYGIMWRNEVTAPANTCPSGWKVPTINEILSGWSSSIGVALQIGVSRRKINGWNKAERIGVALQIGVSRGANYYLVLASGPLKIPASCSNCSSGPSNSTFWITSVPGFFGWEGSSALVTGSNYGTLGVRCLRR